MKKIDFLKLIYGYLQYPNQESVALSLADTHHVGIFSLVINGTEPGELTRVFIADQKLTPYEVQLHSHRYPLRITAIKGDIKHYVALPTEIRDHHTVELSEFEYKSPLNGGSGLKYLKESLYIIKDYSLPIGATIEMDETAIHTMSCSQGSIWIVEEQGFKVDCSKVLGVPFITDGLYNEPKMFQTVDKFQLLKKEIKKLILSYELID